MINNEAICVADSTATFDVFAPVLPESFLSFPLNIKGNFALGGPFKREPNPHFDNGGFFNSSLLSSMRSVCV